MSDNQAQPKIIVDDDWKAKVQAEKAAAAAKKGPPPSEAEEPADAGAERRLPPASFELLITTLATQALAAMGKFPDPVAGHPIVRPDVAKHYIDTLGILEQKTHGNLSEAEAALLTDILHELRMLFISTRGPAPDAK